MRTRVGDGDNELRLECVECSMIDRVKLILSWMQGLKWMECSGLPTKACVTAEERPQDFILSNSANMNHTGVCCGHVSPRKTF